jgi:hypothetical protein
MNVRSKRSALKDVRTAATTSFFVLYFAELIDFTTDGKERIADTFLLLFVCWLFGLAGEAWKRIFLSGGVSPVLHDGASHQATGAVAVEVVVVTYEKWGLCA